MKKSVWLCVLMTVAAMLMVTASGCNIFDFTSDAEKPPTEKAEDYISKGEYAKARKVLADAVKDSVDSFALYLNAKTALLESGVDLVTLVDMIEEQDDLKQGDNLHLLDTIDKMNDAEKTDWYRTNMEIRANYARIWNGKTTGVLKKKDITLGYTVSSMISGILGLRDTNRDGFITNKDFQLDLAFMSNTGASNKSGFGFSGAKIKDESGNVIEDASFNGLTVFLGNWQQKVAPAQKIAAQTNYTPDDINPLIAYVLSLLNDGADSIIGLIADKDATTFDSDKIRNQINNAAAIINFYWYDDGIDNDGDGRIDEEIINGIDDDHDGLVDEDSDHHPSDPTNTENTQYRQVWQTWNNR